jgi:hypothetical protein
MNEALPALPRGAVFLGHFVPRPLANYGQWVPSPSISSSTAATSIKTAKGVLRLLALARRLPFALRFCHLA